MASYTNDDIRNLAKDIVDAINNAIGGSTGGNSYNNSSSYNRNSNINDRITNVSGQISQDELNLLKEKQRKSSDKKARLTVTQKRKKAIEKELEQATKDKKPYDEIKKIQDRLATALNNENKAIQQYNETLNDLNESLSEFEKTIQKSNKTLDDIIRDRERERYQRRQANKNKIAKYAGEDVASQFMGGKLGKLWNAVTDMKHGGTPGKISGGLAIANTIGDAIGQVSNAVTDYQLKSIEIQRESIISSYELLSKQLDTEMSLYNKRLQLANKQMIKQFNAGTSFLSKGILQTTYDNASNNIELGADKLKYKFEEYAKYFSLEAATTKIETQRNINIRKAERQQFGNAVSAGVNGVNDLTGGVANGVLNVGNTILQNMNKLLEARDSLAMDRLSKEIEIREQFIKQATDNFNKNIDVLVEYAKQGMQFTQDNEKTFLSIDKSIKTAGVLFGTNPNNYRKNLRNIQDNLYVTNSSGEKIYLPKSDEDIISAQQNYINNTGRNIELTPNDVKGWAMMSELWDENVLNSLIGQMNYFNMSVANSTELFYDMYQQANKAGISNKKYAETLNKNLRLAQKYTFKGGVEGLAKMALWAEKTKFNMDSLDSMISKVQEGGLEGTITQAAQLQVLGGSAAMGADPFAMQYEAWADPEAFAKRMYDMTKEYGTFNHETGQVDIKGQNAMMVAAIAKAQGRSFEDLRAEINQRTRNEQIDRDLRSAGKDYSEEEKALIYNKAQWDANEQRWKIGDKDVTNLSAQDIKDLKPVEEKIEDRVSGILAAVNYMKGAEIFTKQGMAHSTYDEINQEMKQRTQDILDNYNDNEDNLRTIALNGSKNITEMSKEMLTNLTSHVNMFDGAVSALRLSQTQMKTELDNISQNTSNFVDDLKKLAKGSITMDKFMENQMQYLTGATDKQMGVFRKTDILLQGKLTDALSEYNGQLDYIGTNNNLKRIRQILSQNLSIETGDFDINSLLKNKEFQNILLEESTLGDSILSILDKYDITNFRDGNNWDQRNVFNLYKALETFKDGVLSSSDGSMLTAGAHVTPIQDGSVQLAKSDPRDTAIFAKTGGPFDTLFNGIFGKINDIYNNVLPKSMDYVMPIASRLFKETHDKYTSNGSNLQINPIKIEINGKLELTGSNGQSIDIMSELSKNPTLLRQLTQMISDNISKSINGGRSTQEGLISIPRFKGMGF